VERSIRAGRNGSIEFDKLFFKITVARGSADVGIHLGFQPLTDTAYLTVSVAVFGNHHHAGSYFFSNCFRRKTFFLGNLMHGVRNPVASGRFNLCHFLSPMIGYLFHMMGASSDRIKKRRRWAGTQVVFKKNTVPPMEKRPLK
jgi:hypothetical protein